MCDANIVERPSEVKKILESISRRAKFETIIQNVPNVNINREMILCAVLDCTLILRANYNYVFRMIKRKLKVEWGVKTKIRLDTELLVSYSSS